MYSGAYQFWTCIEIGEQFKLILLFFIYLLVCIGWICCPLVILFLFYQTQKTYVSIFKKCTCLSPIKTYRSCIRNSQLLCHVGKIYDLYVFSYRVLCCKTSIVPTFHISLSGILCGLDCTNVYI